MTRSLEDDYRELRRLSDSEQLPASPFTILASGDATAPLTIDRDSPPVRTWPDAAIHLQYLETRAGDEKARRRLEEVSKILHSKWFRAEWSDFVRSVTTSGKMTKASWSLLCSEEMTERFAGMCRYWGMDAMIGWYPLITSENRIVGRQAVYRCETCGRRSYSHGRVPTLRGSEVSCCDQPNLKPLRLRLTVEVDADVSGRKWGEIHKQINVWIPDVYQLLEGLMKSRGLSDEVPEDLRGKIFRLWAEHNLKRQIRGPSPKEARREFLDMLKAEGRWIYPIAEREIEKRGRHACIRAKWFREFLKEELGTRRFAVGWHESTLARVLTAEMLKGIHKEEFERFGFRFGSLSTIRRYTEAPRSGENRQKARDARMI